MIKVFFYESYQNDKTLAKGKKMRKRVDILIVFTFTFIIPGSILILGADVELTYYEGSEILIQSTQPQDGSHAKFELFPHWCVGDVTKCSEGISIDFWLNAEPADDNSPEMIIMTTGGHTFYSEGWYLIQRFGDQYEFGVSIAQKTWKVNFRLMPGMWAHIVAMFELNERLHVYADDVLFNTSFSEDRTFVKLAFDPITEVLIGLNDDESPLYDAKYFEIKHITIYNRVIDISEASFYADLVFLGCFTSGTSTGTEVNSTFINSCRKTCNDKGNEITFLKNEDSCKCMNKETLPELETGDKCIGTNIWKFYRSASLKKSNPYTVRVIVQPLQTKNYVEPGETVNIIVQTNMKSSVSYEIDYGDGYKEGMKTAATSYSWKTEGTYIIVVKTKLGIMEVIGSTNFTVQNVDEGVSPELVVISGIHAHSQKTGDFELVVASSSALAQCAVQFLAGSTNQYNVNTTKYFEISNKLHSYPSFGGYPVNVTCRNRYGTTETETYFVSKLFDIPFMYFNKGKSFNIDFAGGNEFASEVQAFRNDEKEPLISDYTKNTMTLFHTYTLPTFENLITFKYKGQDVLKRIFFIQNNLDKPAILIDSKDGAWSLTTNITVTIPAGNHIFINCTFNVGDERLFYIDEANDTVDMTFELEYLELGYYDVFVTISNDLSFEMVQGMISVEVPIESISVTTSNITVLNDPVRLDVDVNMGYRGPDKVKFLIDHGDNNTVVYDYRSSTTEFSRYINEYVYADWGIYTICVTAYNEISNITACVLVQVGQNLTYFDVQTRETGRVKTKQYVTVDITCLTGTDIMYTIDYGDGRLFTFTDIELNTTQYVTSGDNITGESIEETTTKPALEEDVPSSNTTQTIVVVDTNNSTFNSTTDDDSIEQNETSSRVKRDAEMVPETEVPVVERFIATRLLPTRIQVKHAFTKTGKFTVKVKATNKFTTRWATLCPTVYVDNTDDSTCNSPNVVLENLQSSRTAPIARIRSNQTNVQVTASGSCPGSRSFKYSFKATKNADGIEVPVDRLCVDDVSESILRIPAVSLSYGLYTITATVSPKGFIRQATMETFYLNIIPSNPYAELLGEKEQSFLVYEATIIDVSPSRDPDLITNNREGLEYFVFCSTKTDYETIQGDSFNVLRDKSSLVYEDITYRKTTSNPFFLYEYQECFDLGANDTTDEYTVIDGEFVFPSEDLTRDAMDFVFKLFVIKEGRVNSTYIDVNIKLTNATDLGDLVNNLDNIKDPAALLRAASSISQSLEGGSESNDATEQRTAFREKIAGAILKNVAGNEKSLKMAKSGYKILGSVTANGDEVSQNARSSSANAVQKSVSNLRSKFGEESMGDTHDAASAAISASANVIPKADKVKHERARRRKRREAVENGDATHADLAAEGDHYYRMILSLDLQDSEELYNFHDCLFSEKVVTKNLFVGAVRSFREDMWMPENILQDSFEDIFTFYGVEWEPFDIEKYINKYCRIIRDRLDQEKKAADKKVSGSSMDAVDNISGLMLGKMQKASDAKKKTRVTTTAPLTTTVVTTTTTTTTTVAPTTVAAEEEEEDDPGLEIKADGIDLKMQNLNPNATGPKKVGGDKGGIDLSPDSMPSGEGDCKVGIKLLVNDDNQFTFGENSEDIKTSLVTIDFSNPCSGSKYKVEDVKPMEITVAGKPEDVPEPSHFMLCTLRDASPDDPKYFNNHPFNLTTNDSSLHFVIWPAMEGDLFEVYMKYMDYPNATYYDYKSVIPHPEDSFADVTDPLLRNHMRHTFFPPPNMTAINGTYRLAVKLKKTEVDLSKDQICINYTTSVVIGGCKFWDAENEVYRGDGCVVGNKTTKWSTQCWCTHLTSFGGDFAVPPNTIDFSNVWAKFDVADNPAVFSTVIALIVLYILLLIWARKKDKEDLIKWGATPLEDNLPNDTYHYQVCVYTGTRKNSGTKSKVSVILSGEICDTGVRQLHDGHRQGFPTGSIYNFILSVEQSLGTLSFMRIFHDNSAKGKLKSWYLNQVQVTDLQTGERFFFLCDRWLAVEEDDGMVDRIIPVASMEDLAAFKQLFNSSVRKKLTSDHLWFSVFSRPTRSAFTRVQRISCCMSLLFMTMITNAMWFKSEDNTQQTNALKLGPVSFTLQQVFVSFASTMIVFPVNFILITFFRRCKPKKNSVLQKNQRITQKGKWKNVTNGSQLWGAPPKRSAWKKFKDAAEDLVRSHQRSKYQGSGEVEDEEPDDDFRPEPRIAGDPDADKKIQEKKKKKPSHLPHWCIYIAWVLCFLSIITPGFFTILYSMEWGKEKANEWLTTFLMSFFQSVIVVQPLKVMCLVAFIACILKRPDIDEEDSGEELNNVIAAHDEEMLGKTNETIDAIAARRKENNSKLKPPDLEELEKARQTRLNEIKMEMVIRELAVYLVFVLILFFLSYQQRDSASFTYATNLKNYFANGFDSVTTGDQFWSWVDKKLLPALYTTHYDNGTRMPFWWEKRCILDHQSRRIGLPRIRQLRVKDDTCTVHPDLDVLIKHCRDAYGWTDDDAGAYYPGWVKPSEENETLLFKSKTIDPWVYANSLKLKNAPYVGTISSYKGGGFTMFLEREINRTRLKLNDLIQQIWIDANTRAVFVEFTVYNPNINLFGSVIMLVEFMSSGGATHRTEFKVFRLLSYVGGLGILVLMFEILYALFTLYFLVQFIKKLKKHKRKYFSSFWNKLEFALLVFSCATIAMYAFKQIITAVTISALKNSAKADFVNLQTLALYDEFYGWMCAFVVFLATVQFLKLLQFNKKMNMLGDTISLAAKDLKVFFITFTLYFWTFVATGFLLFGNTMLDYASIINAAESVFSFALGAFDFEAMADSNKVLGPLYFFLFIGVVVVGLMSIFLTILADAFTQVKEQVGEQSNDYELVDFMWRRIKGVMGFKTVNV